MLTLIFSAVITFGPRLRTVHPTLLWLASTDLGQIMFYYWTHIETLVDRIEFLFFNFPLTDPVTKGLAPPWLCFPSSTPPVIQL